MSPRAACRLESLGFGEVYDYVAGKLDWMAAGLPTEGPMLTAQGRVTLHAGMCRPLAWMSGWAMFGSVCASQGGTRLS